MANIAINGSMVNGMAMNGSLLFDNSNDWTPLSSPFAYIIRNDAVFHDNHDGTCTLGGGVLTRRYPSGTSFRTLVFPSDFKGASILNSHQSPLEVLTSDPNTTASIANFNIIDGSQNLWLKLSYPNTVDMSTLVYVSFVYKLDQPQADYEPLIKLKFNQS